MNRLKRWLVERVLPVYAREELIKENERLRERVVGLEAYIDGLHWGIRAQRRIVIDAREGQK